jgi:acyl-[acyl-carrier-protein]-phospholipid O-acyltransferase/long-chain-fatty-acid--[acyl-carrier-protein] ligase
MFSIGIAIGSLLCNRVLKGTIHAKYVPLGILGMTLFTLDLCWASSSGATPIIAHSGGLAVFITNLTGVRIALDLLLLSIAGGFYIVPLYAIIQTKSEPEHRSRVVACSNIFGALFMVAAAVSAMAMVGLGLSTVDLFLITGIVNGLVAVLAWKKMPDLAV